METLLVDGYNVLGHLGRMGQNDSGNHSPLSDSRDALIHLLDDYIGYVGGTCVLVFDGHHAKRNPGMQLQIGNVTVVYTKSNHSADQYIEKLAGLLIKQRQTVRVVSGDATEQSIILSLGALRMPVRELLYDMQRVKEQNGGHAQYGKPNRIDDRLDESTHAIMERMRLGKYPMEDSNEEHQ